MVRDARCVHYPLMTMKLLIVDDSELIRTRLLGLVCGIEGIDTIRTAGTLAQAMQGMQLEPPTLVTLDLHLPDCNAMRRVRSMKQLSPSTRIAVLSNDVNALVREKCLRDGASWFFDKSTEFEKVLDLVRTQAALHAVNNSLERFTHA